MHQNLYFTLCPVCWMVSLRSPVTASPASGSLWGKCSLVQTEEWPPGLHQPPVRPLDETLESVNEFWSDGQKRVYWGHTHLNFWPPKCYQFILESKWAKSPWFVPNWMKYLRSMGQKGHVQPANITPQHLWQPDMDVYILTVQPEYFNMLSNWPNLRLKLFSQK